ncbi:hypothetical protein IU11_03565, partial [Cellulosimicrobium sp. MM]
MARAAVRRRPDGQRLRLPGGAEDGDAVGGAGRASRRLRSVVPDGAGVPASVGASTCSSPDAAGDAASARASGAGAVLSPSGAGVGSAVDTPAAIPASPGPPIPGTDRTSGSSRVPVPDARPPSAVRSPAGSGVGRSPAGSWAARELLAVRP